MASFVVTVQPTLEPLTVAEAVTHLRVGAGNTEPAPNAPSVALAGAGAGNVDNGAHRYRATFVTADGETEGGTISDVVTVADKTVNGKVTVSAIPLGGSAVTARKLYRTVAAGSTYFLLATISDNTTTSYTDNIADSSLGAAVSATNTTADPELTSLIKSARQWIEQYCGRSLITQTLRYKRDRFPSYLCDRDSDLIRLPQPNLLSVTTVQYVDTDGATQTMSSGDYAVNTDALPGYVALGYGKFWPTARCQRDAVTIAYTAGYGPARSDVPEPIRAAMKLILGDLYENREVSVIGATRFENPAAMNLLSPYRVMEAT